MKGELWQIINNYQPEQEKLLWLANIQLAIHENMNEVYGANISYPHFLERKDNFHAALRKTWRLILVDSDQG